MPEIQGIWGISSASVLGSWKGSLRGVDLMSIDRYFEAVLF